MYIPPDTEEFEVNAIEGTRFSLSQHNIKNYSDSDSD